MTAQDCPLSGAPDVVYLGAENFLKGLYQRPQALALQLARSSRVLYANPEYCSLAHYGFDRLFRKHRLPPVGLRPAARNLWILDFMTPVPRLLASPSHGPNLVAMAWQVRRALKRLGFQNCIYWVEIPWTAHLVKYLPRARVYYDYLDDFPAFFSGRTKTQAAQLETRLLRTCDGVIASSNRLAEKARRLNANVHVVRNGVVIDHYGGDGRDEPAELRSLPRPILGYIGHVGSWFDWTLLREIALRYPQASIVIAGRGEIPHGALPGVSNVLHVGLKPHSEIPGYLAAFDVCLIPFVVNELTLAVNPTKFYEYCAAGKPTVSVTLPELEPYREVCYLAGSRAEFVSAVDLALGEQAHPERAAELARRRRTLAEQNSWDARGREIDAILSTSPPGPA